MKTALVTGASRGIGKAIAEELSRDHDVIRWSSEDCDLSDPTAVEDAVAKLGLERLDVLVHNAGIWDEAPLDGAERDRWRRIFEVNVFAVADLTRLLLPALREAGGQIVMINSGSGYKSGPGQAMYSGTKFALRALTMALREEERGKVRVSSVHPGRVDTEMQEQIQANNGIMLYDGSRYVRPESVSSAVRTVVDATDECTIEEISVRPVLP